MKMSRPESFICTALNLLLQLFICIFRCLLWC